MLKEKLKKKLEEQKNRYLESPYDFMGEQVFIKPFTLSQFSVYVRIITGEIQGESNFYLISHCVVDKEGKKIFDYNNTEDRLLLDASDIKEANDLIKVCIEANASPEFEKKDLQTEVSNIGNTESL